MSSIFTSKVRWLVILAVVALLALPSATSARAQAADAATIATELSDYSPGDAVRYTGSGFQAGEFVDLLAIGSTNGSRVTSRATADASGAFTGIFVLADIFEATYSLTATGVSSGRVANASFLDGTEFAVVSPTAPVTLTASAGTQNYVVRAFVTNSGGSDTQGTPGQPIKWTVSPSTAGSFSSTCTVTQGGPTSSASRGQASTMFTAGASNVTGFIVTATVMQAADCSGAPAANFQPLSFAASNITGAAVQKQNQTITFGALDAKTFGDADFSLTATASSNLAVSYSATGACTVTGATVHITGAGSCAITASQGGDANYNAAPNVQQTLTINKAKVTITLGGLSATYDGSPKSATFTTDPAGVAGVSVTYDGSSTAPTNAGSYAVVASLGSNANYEAQNATGTLVINKAPATISLSGLSATYDGSPKSATATTTPAGLSVVSITYDGSATAPTNAGSYAVAATLDNANYTGSTTGTLVINKAQATIALGGLTGHTYDGSPKAATFTTTPANLSGVSLTYDGSATAPTNAGSYAVVAKLDNPNYTAPDATGTLTIAKAKATISLSGLTHTYDGSPKAATTTTAPSGLSGVSVTYDSAATAPTNAGSYAVVAKLSNTNYEAPDATGTLVINKAQATISLSGLTHTYDGSAKAATATTSPANLSGVSISYAQNNAPVAAPTNAGSYAVTAKLQNANYEASDATGTLVINKANQTVAFAAGTPTTKTFGDAPFTVSASATSKLAVTLAVKDGSKCTLANDTVTITGAGSCTITASQAGDTNYNAATPVDAVITINKATQTITFAKPGDVTLANTTTISPAASSKLPVTVTSTTPSICTVSGTTVSTLAAGTCTLKAAQAGDANYFAAPDVTVSFQVLYAAGGTCNGAPGHVILQPVNADGTSTFKQGSTVPLKFRVCDANGKSIGTAGVVDKFEQIKITADSTSVVNETVDSTTPDTTFRWDATSQQWIFNMSTKSLKANNDYTFRITLNDGSTIIVSFGLR